MAQKGVAGWLAAEFSAGKANFSLAVVKNVNISCGLMRTAVALVLVWVWMGLAGFGWAWMWVVVWFRHGLGSWWGPGLEFYSTASRAASGGWLKERNCPGAGIQIV